MRTNRSGSLPHKEKKSVAAKERLSLRRNCTHHGSGKNPAADTTPVPCSTERIPCSAGRSPRSRGLFFICHPERSKPPFLAHGWCARPAQWRDLGNITTAQTSMTPNQQSSPPSLLKLAPIRKLLIYYPR